MNAAGVVVTREEGAEGPLSRELRAHGLEVLSWPAVAVTPADPEPLVAALADLARFHWIVFASRHAVAAVLARIERPPTGVRVAAVGQATAQVLRQRGWPVDRIPAEASAAGLVAEFAAEGVPAGTRVLFPASSRALPTLGAGLTALGAEVVQVEAYRTDAAALDVAACKARIEQGGIGAVTFASPSAVVELERALGAEHFNRLTRDAMSVAIGATTARELAQRGLRYALADESTLPGLALTTLKVLQARS